MKVMTYKPAGTLFVIALLLIGLKSRVQAAPAEDLYTQGQAAYNDGDFVTAVAKWQASYDLSKESGLLFNLGQARRLSGDCPGALAAYRQFIAADTDQTSEQHKLANDFTRELEGTCPAKPVLTVPPKIVAAPKVGRGLTSVEGLNDREFDRPQSGRTWKIAGLVTGGVGLTTLAIGLGLGHHGAAIGDEITAACRTSCDWTALKAKDARGARDVAIGKTLDVVVVAAIAGGAIFYYLGVRHDSLAITPTPRDGGAVISWIGSW